MTNSRERLATQVNAEILAAVRAIAKAESRHMRALVHEALVDLIEKRRKARSGARVKAVYLESLHQYGELYAKLAR